MPACHPPTAHPPPPRHASPAGAGPGVPRRHFQKPIAASTIRQFVVMSVGSLAASDSGTGLAVYRGTACFVVCRFVIPAFWRMAALWFLEQPDNTRHMQDRRGRRA